MKPADAVSPSPASLTNSEDHLSCSAISETAFRTKSTIEAKVTGSLNAGRQKPGKKLWLTSIYEMDLADCHILAGAPIYGVVTAASSSKNPAASELSLKFDAVDCLGRDKQPMKLAVVGVSAPPDEVARGHDLAPTELQGSARQITATVASTNAYDANLSSGAPGMVITGSVVGFKNMKLEPQAGPQCSARFTSTNHDLVLPSGTILHLVVRVDE